MILPSLVRSVVYLSAIVYVVMKTIVDRFSIGELLFFSMSCFSTVIWLLAFFTVSQLVQEEFYPRGQAPMQPAEPSFAAPMERQSLVNPAQDQERERNAAGGISILDRPDGNNNDYSREESPRQLGINSSEANISVEDSESDLLRQSS